MYIFFLFDKMLHPVIMSLDCWCLLYLECQINWKLLAFEKVPYVLYKTKARMIITEIYSAVSKYKHIKALKLTLDWIIEIIYFRYWCNFQIIIVIILFRRKSSDVLLSRWEHDMAKIHIPGLSIIHVFIFIINK